MSTPERCLAQAEEAERMASVVSYERDRERLTRQAAEWRARAEELRAEQLQAPAAPAPAAPAPSWLRRVSQTLSGRRRTRDR